MTDERPLHVRVAEALGWTYVGRGEDVGYGEPGWEGEPPAWDVARASIPRRLDQHIGIPRYDTDWSATGPLIERLGISIVHDPRPVAHCWDAKAENITVIGTGPLDAVCKLLSRLDATGDLHLHRLLAREP